MVGCHAMYLYHMPYSRGRAARVHLGFLARYVTVIYNAHVDIHSMHDNQTCSSSIRKPARVFPVSKPSPDLHRAPLPLDEMLTGFEARSLLTSV